MLFRRIIFLCLIGFFTGAFALNIITTLSPFNIEKIEELIEDEEIAENDEDKLNEEIEKLIDDGFIFEYLSTNAYSAGVLLLVSFFTFLSAIHLSVDKLFFKKFYEEPAYGNAFRHAGFFVLWIGTVFTMNLYGFDAIAILLATIGFVLLEVFYKVFFVKKNTEEDDRDGRGKLEGLEKEKKEREEPKPNPVSVPDSKS